MLFQCYPNTLGRRSINEDKQRTAADDAAAANTTNYLAPVVAADLTFVAVITVVVANDAQLPLSFIAGTEA